MNKNELDEKAIFKAAFSLPNGEVREEFLSKSCQGDPAMLDRLRTLLRQSTEDSKFLESPAVQFDTSDTVDGRIDITHIGPYRIREKIGEGGMGVVYVAEQTKPVQRKVALKIIKPGMDTKEVIARFEAERQALAFMEHPNIARVLDAGATESGRSYFVMELFRGIPITEYCDQVQATPRDRLQLFTIVCEAVQHAHQKGIIHRDIKPSNVLVTQVSAKPVVKVIDFGLAKAISGQKLTDKTVYTGFMKLMGTPVYMSPEQAGLSGLDVDTRSDVYSLGILLYELLTGTTPLDKTEIQKKAYDELCRQIREVEAPKPSSRISTLTDAERSTIAQHRQLEPTKLSRLLDGDLDVVALKALEKDRDRRYGTPLDLAEDIDRFLNDEPVLAAPPSPMYLVRNYVRRHKAVMITAATILALLVSATAVSTWFAVRATNAERKAEQRLVAVGLARKQAEEMASERQRLLYAADMAMAAQLWDNENGELRKIEALLTAWLPSDKSQEDWRDFSWRYQWTRLHKSASVTARDTLGATISSNGRLLTATTSGLYRWDESGLVSQLVWGRAMDNIVFSPNHLWAVLTLDGHRQLVDTATGRTVLKLPQSQFSFSTRGEHLATWESDEQTAKVWKLTRRMLPRDGSSSSADSSIAVPLASESGAVRLPNKVSHMQLFDDGQSLLLKSTSYEMTALLGDQQDPISWAHRSMVWHFSWSPNGRLIASANYNGQTHLRLRTDPVHKVVIATHGKPVTVLRFSPDGTRLAVGGSDGTIDIWDVSELLRVSQRSASELETLVAKAQLDESKDAAIAAIESAGQPILLQTIKAHLAGGIQSLAFSTDGAKLASFGGGVAKLWDLDRVQGRYDVADFGDDLSGRCGVEIEDSKRGVRVKGYAPDSVGIVSGELRVGDTIVGLSDDVQGELTDLGSKKVVDIAPLLAGRYRSKVRLRVVGENDDRRVVELRRNTKVDPRPIRLCFSPDGETVAIAGQRTGTTTFNLETGESQRFRITGNSVAIAPNGRLLAMDFRKQVAVWDLIKNEKRALLDGSVRAAAVGPNGQQGSVAFSPDGNFLAMGTGYPFNTGMKRSDLKVWRVRDWTEIGAPLFQNDCVLSDLTFTPDSKYLLATDHGGIVRLWNTKTWKLEDRSFDAGNHSLALAISNDGRLLATGGPETTLWDFRTARKQRVLLGASPWALAFSPDGRTLASGVKHNVILWDVATGRQLYTLHAHSDAVMGVAFSPDGNKLATIGNEGVLRIWTAATIDEIDKHPGTYMSMLRLGQMWNKEERYAEAEAVLRRLLSRLPQGHRDIDKTLSEINVARNGQGKPRVSPRLE